MKSIKLAFTKIFVSSSTLGIMPIPYFDYKHTQMHSMSKTFGLTFENIPIVNLRLEFIETYKDALALVRREAICPALLCAGTDNLELDCDLNWAMRSTIINIESYIHYAVWDILGSTRSWTPEKRQTWKNPYGHRKGICGSYYDILPALVRPEYSLRLVNNSLWQRTLALYKEVRNPLFHGKAASQITGSDYFSVIEHVRLMYKWIDSWHTHSWGEFSCDHLVSANNSFKSKPFRDSV